MCPTSCRRASGGSSVEALVRPHAAASADHASDLGFHAAKPEKAFQNQAKSVPTLVQGNALTSVFVIPHIRYSGGPSVLTASWISISASNWVNHTAARVATPDSSTMKIRSLTTSRNEDTSPGGSDCVAT